MRSDLRALVGAVIAVRSWKLPVALALMAVTGLAEGAGLLLLIPLLDLVGIEVQGAGTLGSIERVMAAVLSGLGVPLTLPAVLAAYVATLVACRVAALGQAVLIADVEQEFAASLRRTLYTAITRATWTTFVRSRSSDITHLLTNEADRAATAAGRLAYLCANLVPTSVYVVLSFAVSPAAALFVIACGAVLLLMASGAVRAAAARGEALSDAWSRFHGTIAEHMGSMRIARAYAAGRHGEEFERIVTDLRQVHVAATRSEADLRFWLDTGSAVILGLTVYVALTLLGLPTAEMLVLLYVFARVTPRLFDARNTVQFIATLLPGFTSIVRARTRYEDAAAPEPDGRQAVTFTRAVEVREVSFAYEGDRPVLRGVTLTVPAGRTVALVGPSGAGKSTLADLIMGLLTPASGDVLVDGAPLTPDRFEAWRDQVGYVPQEPFLFHDTVRANLLWARPEATGPQLARALELAGAAAFVARLPRGLDTVVGDRGVLMSGGERQRLALARALVREPSFLLLDEATNALDPDGERRFYDAIRALHGRLTILIIAHRSSGITGADLVYLLEDGRVTASPMPR